MPCDQSALRFALLDQIECYAMSRGLLRQIECYAETRLVAHLDVFRHFANLERNNCRQILVFLGGLASAW